MTDNEKNGEDRSGGRFLYAVNSTSYRSKDGKIDGEEILSTSGHHPADEHVLIRILDRGTVSIGLDEKVDLREGGVEVFRAFHGDRTFSFTTAGRGYEWGASVIAEPELRSIARIDHDEVFALDREAEADLIIDDGADIRLDAEGTERVKVRPRPEVTVTVNSKPVTLSRGWHTGAEIKAAAIDQGVKIGPDFTLDEEPTNGGDAVTIGDNDRTFISGGERFGAVDHHEDS